MCLGQCWGADSFFNRLSAQSIICRQRETYNIIRILYVDREKNLIFSEYYVDRETSNMIRVLNVDRERHII